MDGTEAHVSVLGPADATVAVRRWVPRGRSTEDAGSDLRLELAERLRESGVWK
jgi:hypothetical protein